MKTQTCVALFRGINVAGKNLLPMKELTAILESTGASAVRTYIQSGNAVFTCRAADAGRIGAKIAAEVKKRRGFEPVVLVLEPGDLETAMARNPFPDATADPQRLNLGFLASTPRQPDLGALEALSSPTERFRVIDRVFYLHAPDGIGRSKLAAGAEKKLGVPMTIRNWRTVSTLWDMARAASERPAREHPARRERPIP